MNVKDLREAPTLFPINRARMGLTQLLHNWEELSRIQSATIVRIESHKPVMAMRNELITRQVIEDLLRQQWHNLMHGGAVTFHHCQQLLHLLLTKRHLPLLCLQVRQDHHETCKSNELLTSDDPVPLCIKEINKFQALLLGQGEGMSLTHRDQHRDELLWLQHSAVVLVELSEVVHAVHSKLRAEQLFLHIYRQQRHNLVKAIAMLCHDAKQLLNLVPTHLHSDVMPVPGVVQVAHDNDEAAELRKLIYRDHSIPVLVKDLCELLACIVIH
mmetsp:Transcript_80693/g.152526  ORF Transcript_80693/g.152526 Transcript_80693/m.152526 type:complete len:271 (-) Transcript_80693:1842-2654(-)